jgi:integrase
MKPVPKTVYSWKGIVRKLVSHLANNPKLTVAQAMTWNAAAITQGDLINWKDSLVTKIGPTTVRNHLTIFRTLYNYAADNKLLPKAVAETVKGVKHKAKKRPGTRRLGYTDDEARAILTAARAELDPVLRFSPWLAAALGTRIDEICGAMVPDVEIEHDAFWFNIRLDYREVDPDQVAEIKSDNAERKLPIPPAVWRDEGFADYIAGLPENGPLFPHLKPDRFGRRGGNGSKRVQRWVRNKVGIKDKRKAPSHSWRHRFRSILRNPTYGIGEDVADYMAGHGGEGSVGRDYGEYRDAMVVAISRLPPPLPPERQLAA